MTDNFNVDSLKACIKGDVEMNLVIKMHKEQLENYKSKNVLYAQIMDKLKMHPNNLSDFSKTILNDLIKLQEASKLNKLDERTLELAFLQQAWTRQKYQMDMRKLNLQIEILQVLTDANQNDIANMNEEIENAKKKIQMMTPKDLEKLKLKIKSYENKLLKFFENFPWLKNPEFNVLNVQNEIRILYDLREEVEGLKCQTDKYGGLKPDVYDAKDQLAKLKEEYEEICQQIG